MAGIGRFITGGIEAAGRDIRSQVHKEHQKKIIPVALIALGLLGLGLSFYVTAAVSTSLLIKAILYIAGIAFASSSIFPAIRCYEEIREYIYDINDMDQVHQDWIDWKKGY